MYLIFFLVIISNVLAFFYKIESWYFFVGIGSIIGVYKGVTSEEFKNIFNFHKIEFQLTKEHVSELLLALLIGVMPFNIEIIESKFSIVFFIQYIAFSLFFYRFLCFNLFEKAESS